MDGQSQTGILKRAYENGQYIENHPIISLYALAANVTFSIQSKYLNDKRR